MQKWEYRVIQTHKRHGEDLDVFVERLNKMGRKGWELVGYGEIHLMDGLVRKGANLFFKRPLEAD